MFIVVPVANEVAARRGVLISCTMRGLPPDRQHFDSLQLLACGQGGRELLRYAHVVTAK